MTCKELIEYLSEFNPDKEVSVTISNPEKRIIHKVSEVFFIDGLAALMFETVESEPMDGESK